MANVDRLIRRKARLTDRLRQIDELERQRGDHVPLPKATLLRARIYRVDLLLERAGVFDR